jgi:hypothetical protein
MNVGIVYTGIYSSSFSKCGVLPEVTREVEEHPEFSI